MKNNKPEEQILVIFGATGDLSKRKLIPAGTWGPYVADSLIEGQDIKWRQPCRALTGEDNFCKL